MKHKLQTLLSAAVGVMLALPASAARVDNRVFIEDAVSGYSSGTGWSLAGGADASQVEVSEGVMTFDLDADQNVTYTPATPSAADKAATVEVSGTTFSVAYEPPADLPDGSQASIVLGQWADGATGPTYYGWAGETNATGALVWTQLSSTVVSDPTAAVDVKMVFDYTAQTKTVSFFVDNVQVGSSLALADQDKTQVSAVSFSGAGSIADLDGTYAVNVYTVTFKDGTDVVSTVDVDEGETVAAADIPAAPPKTGYTFDAWQSNGADHDFTAAVTQDFFVTAKYDLNEYVITWLDGDGNSLGTSTVNHGETPAYTGATPTKTETTEYTYTFNDTWSPAIVPATAATTYTAQFDAVAKAFTITFVDEDGTTVLGTSSALPGVVPVYDGETPAKASDNQNDYTFGGWSPALAPATGATTYTATYSSTPRNYTITWNFKAADGTDTSDTSTVHWGDTPSHADPAGYVANNTIYAFQAWSPAPAAYDGTVAAYTATYTSTAAKATVITVTGVTTNTVGTYASFAEAVRAADDGDTVVLLANDTADATKTAQADRLVVTNAITIDFGEYTYSVPGSLEPTANWCALFIDADTTVKGTTGGIDCLDKEDPNDKPGVYAFNVRNGATLTIEGGAYHGGGTVVQTQLGTTEINGGTFSVTAFDAPYGTDFALNCVDANYPANAGFDIRGGTFVGFDPQDIAAEGDHTDFTGDGYVAIDDGNGNWVVQAGYNVTFEDYDGTVLETLRVPAGDTPAPTSAPTRADDVVESATSTTVTTYAFDGWTVAPATADVTYTATYTSTVTVTDYVAQIAGGAKYATLAAAVAAAADGDTVVLLDDVTLTERVEPNVGANTAITIDLGGYTIARTGTSGNGSVFDVKSGDVTITNGVIDCTQDDTAIAKDGVYAITSRSGSNVTLADLTVTVNSECGACAYPFAGSTMTIESGTYANVTTTPYRYNTSITGMAVNQPNNATQNLVIKGGSFSQYDPQLGDDSGAMTDFTDEGFVAIDDGNGHFVVQAGYNVTFDANGGTPAPEAQRVAAGDLATAPASNPAKTGDAQYSYAFSAWQLNGANYDFSVAPAADITLVADYTETVNEYTISWDTDGDGAVDDTTTVAYGTVPTHADGSKTGDAQYTYTFTGWDNEPVAVTGAATYTATFSTAVNEYTISWDTDGDGAVDDTTTVAYGTVPTHADGSKTGDAQYSYTFTGWDTEPVAVTGVATYTATFSTAVNEYTISWDTDGDGAVDDTTTVAYGTVPTHADGSKTGDAQYSYTFTGWDTEPVAVTGVATYTATFSTAVNEYTISWDTDGDGTVDDTTTVAYGTVPTHADGAKAADAQYTYSFAGWDNEPVAVTGAATYTATFTETPVAPPAIDGVTLALKGDVYLDAVSITNPAVVKFVATTNGAAADVTPTVTASAGAATVSGDTVTFTGVPWNDPVDWTLAYNDATLPGRFYAKAETQWFSAAADSLTDIQGLAEGMKGVEPATESATNQMVRIEVTIEIPDGAMDSLPKGTDVGDTRTGFAVAQLTGEGDTAPAYYGYNGTDWVKLVGAAPAANTEVDLLIVLDTAANTARYYVDGVALSTTNTTPVYAIPMAAGDAVIKGIGFANPEGVKSAVVAEYDVPYAAAVGDTPYMVGAEGVAAADKTGAQTLYLLADGIDATIELALGETVVVDASKGSFLSATPVSVAASAPAGAELRTTVDGDVTTYTVAMQTFDITFADYNGSPLHSTNVVYGATGYGPAADPSREDYVFLGWTNAVGGAVVATAALPAAVADAAYTAVYEQETPVEAVNPGSGLLPTDVGVKPIEVTDAGFVVHFRGTAGVTYGLLATTDLTLTEEQWKALTPVATVDCTAQNEGDVLTLVAPIGENDTVKFFKIGASATPAAGN